MGLNDGITVTDHVTAQMVDCTPDPPPAPAPPLPPAPTADSPVQQAMQATLTQTGADPPPPVVTRG